MKSRTKISINDPCSEIWDEMTPQERGRWCMSCERIILDFTNKSDQEILDHIKTSNGNICGRFKQGQLDRELEYNKMPKEIPLWQKVAASLFLLVGVENAYAKKITSLDLINNLSISQSDTDKNISKEIKTNAQIQTKVEGDTIKVYGKVADGKTNEGIPFVSIMVLGTDIKTMSDFNGYYTLKLPKELIQNNLNIKYEVIGYLPTTELLKQRNNITLLQGQTSLNVALHSKGTIGIVDVVISKKWWQFWK